MKTALIIEDNEDNMRLITLLLEKSAYLTLQAFTGMGGYEIALQKKPDFIILDIQLPDIEGTEVLQKIRTSEIGNSIPVIAMTSYAMSGDRERLLAAGCDGYIEKPIDPERVIAQIRSVIGE
ncbi:MAG: response regulator [Geobacteraceae bacterium]|nr:response regulator [Geobacteraceae bacterium]